MADACTVPRATRIGEPSRAEMREECARCGTVGPVDVACAGCQAAELAAEGDRLGDACLARTAAMEHAPWWRCSACGLVGGPAGNAHRALASLAKLERIITETGGYMAPEDQAALREARGVLAGRTRPIVDR